MEFVKIRSMKTRKRFIRFVIVAAVIILLLVWFMGKWSNDVSAVPFVDIDISVSSELELMANGSDNGTKLTFKGPENVRQKAVVDEFLHAWNNYKKYAWGYDELKPVSHGWINYMGVGLTIVDSLDTLYIMGLNEEFQIARDWVAHNLSFTRDAYVSTFEITIRGLGGLLSAYHISQDRIFLDKAMELGAAFKPCFNVRHSRVPCNLFNLKFRAADFRDTSTAEAGTLQLELRDLSRSSKVRFYENVADFTSHHIHSLPKSDGLVPKFISLPSGKFRSGSALSVGAGADSYYEYLLKQWIQSGKTRQWLLDDYLAAVNGIKKRLLRYSHPNNLAFVGILHGSTFASDMEHLACFLPATLVLGVIHGLDKSHLEMAANLTKTCYAMYQQTATGLSADVVSMNTDPHEGKDIFIRRGQARYLLRPETVESLFYMFYITGHEQYRRWAWSIFTALRQYARVDGGFAVVENVNSIETDSVDSLHHSDQMDSYFLAETLKYLYLIFAERPQNVLSLKQFLLNTEAHLLPIYAG